MFYHNTLFNISRPKVTKSEGGLRYHVGALIASPPKLIEGGEGGAQNADLSSGGISGRSRLLRLRFASRKGNQRLQNDPPDDRQKLFGGSRLSRVFTGQQGLSDFSGAPS